MFTTTAVLLLSAFSAHAIVVPSEPGPGSVYNEGATCHIAWGADAANAEVWSSMDISLRTGSNLAMVDITVIATGQDGSVAGSLDFPCPDVTPNAAIYFYEFRPAGAAPGGEAVTWTTRFAIADASGAVVDPENPTQPDGAAIPWGTGSLESGNPSGVAGVSASGSAVRSGTAAPSAPASASATGASRAVTPSAAPSDAPSGSSRVTSTRSTSSAAGAAQASSSGSPNAASSLGTNVSGFLATAVMAFTLLL